MTEGVIVGGWKFVWAAYSLTALAFAVYGASLVARLRRERRRAGEGRVIR